MKLFGKKKREIEQLRIRRDEKIADAAYWYIHGDHKEYMLCVMEASDINNQLIERRRKLF